MLSNTAILRLFEFASSSSMIIATLLCTHREGSCVALISYLVSLHVLLLQDSRSGHLFAGHEPGAEFCERGPDTSVLERNSSGRRHP